MAFVLPTISASSILSITPQLVDPFQQATVIASQDLLLSSPATAVNATSTVKPALALQVRDVRAVQLELQALHALTIPLINSC